MPCTQATASSPAVNEMKVPISVGRKMSAPLKPTSPWSAAMAWRMAITEVGISVMPAVLSTRNITMALLAVSFCGLISCSSRMAFRPSGVAALSSPSMLALKFITMLPPAGWPRGMSGNRRLNSGAMARANSWIIPACSPIFMMPSHRLMMPTRPMEMSKPVLAVSNRAVSTRVKMVTSPCSSLTRATRKPIRMKAIQTMLRAMRSGGQRGRPRICEPRGCPSQTSPTPRALRRQAPYSDCR